MVPGSQDGLGEARRVLCHSRLRGAGRVAVAVAAAAHQSLLRAKRDGRDCRKRVGGSQRGRGRTRRGRHRSAGGRGVVAGPRRAGGGRKRAKEARSSRHRARAARPGGARLAVAGLGLGGRGGSQCHQLSRRCVSILVSSLRKWVERASPGGALATAGVPCGRHGHRRGSCCHACVAREAHACARCDGRRAASGPQWAHGQGGQ
mmetsp:Transcript_14312/g.35413  ORF Transcript_14312/g.35413 Transcript_14312/m.35413 type:complete len:204 (+) Transcript_14312:3709-4320(+)